MSGQLDDVRSVLSGPIERIARWWTSATQEERFAFLQKTVKGEAGCPPLRTVQIAIYLAEAEAGEIAEG